MVMYGILQASGRKMRLDYHYVEIYFGSGSGFLEYDEFQKSMEIIQIVHGVVGDNTEMLIEGHGRFNRSTAMKIGRVCKFIEHFLDFQVIHQGIYIQGCKCIQWPFSLMWCH